MSLLGEKTSKNGGKVGLSVARLHRCGVKAPPLPADFAINVIKPQAPGSLRTIHLCRPAIRRQTPLGKQHRHEQPHVSPRIDCRGGVCAGRIGLRGGPTRRSRGSGIQVARSPSTNGQRGSRSRACRNMSGDESIPMTSALGNRSSKSSVELPGPQPRSMTRRGDRRGTCANRSRGGRVRSSSNLRYWLADQASAVCLLGTALAMRSVGACHSLAEVQISRDKGIDP
jgi:hypothetical protein